MRALAKKAEVDEATIRGVVNVDLRYESQVVGRRRTVIVAEKQGEPSDQSQALLEQMKNPKEAGIL